MIYFFIHETAESEPPSRVREKINKLERDFFSYSVYIHETGAWRCFAYGQELSDYFALSQGPLLSRSVDLRRKFSVLLC